MNLGKTFLLIFLSLLLLSFASVVSRAQTATVTPTPSQNNSQAISDLQNKIRELETKIADLKGQAETLSSQIGVMDSQIQLTEYRIKSTQEQITNLTLDIDTATKKISGLESSLNDLISVLLKRVVTTYEVGTIQPFQILLTSNDAQNFIQRLNYLKLAQEHDKSLIFQTQQAKVDYANQKTIYENQKKEIELLKQQLEAYNSQLDQEKQAKQKLLDETKGSEATYQNLLAQARTQLNALSNFSKSITGGVSIVPHEDKSDDWGRYYNQRDANWGNNLIGGSGETISSVGCLLTSYAMVVTHFGGSITPAEVAANSGNFWYSTALFLKPGPSANGHSATSTSNNPSIQELRDALNSGKAVIAGLSYDGGPIADHWVVLRSVDGDSFKINDPLYQGAMNVSLNDHYSGLKIVEARIYN